MKDNETSAPGLTQEDRNVIQGAADFLRLCGFNNYPEALEAVLTRASAATASPDARIEELRKGLFEARDAMRVMSNWVKQSDPAGHSWGVHMVDRANAVLSGASAATVGEASDPNEIACSSCGLTMGENNALAAMKQAEPGADERRLPGVHGVSRIADNPCALLLLLKGEPSDDALREIHDRLRAQPKIEGHHDETSSRAKDALRGIGACIADPMWANHAEVSKQTLKYWHKSLTDVLAAQSGQRAGVAEDAARYRRIRELWFEWGMHNINTPLGAALNALANVADRESLDAVLDSINAAAPTQQQGENK